MMLRDVPEVSQLEAEWRAVLTAVKAEIKVWNEASKKVTQQTLRYEVTI